MTGQPGRYTGRPGSVTPSSSPLTPTQPVGAATRLPPGGARRARVLDLGPCRADRIGLVPPSVSVPSPHRIGIKRPDGDQSILQCGLVNTMPGVHPPPEAPLLMQASPSQRSQLLRRNIRGPPISARSRIWSSLHSFTSSESESIHHLPLHGRNGPSRCGTVIFVCGIVLGTSSHTQQGSRCYC
jgi:hypothetical protein